MMTRETARRQLGRIADAIPSYRAMMNTDAGGQRLGSRWVQMLERSSARGTHLVRVVDAILNGHLEPVRKGEPNDRIIFTLIREIEAMHAREMQQEEQYRRYHDPAIKARKAKPTSTPASKLFKLPPDQLAGELEKERIDELPLFRKNP